MSRLGVVDSAMVFLIGVSVLLLALAFMAWIADRIGDAFERKPYPRRLSARIPAREMELVGDDYRDCVAGYFARSERRAEIINHVTGANDDRK